MTPTVIPRAEHPISRKRIDEDALKVLYRLHRHGFLAYLVEEAFGISSLGKLPKISTSPRTLILTRSVCSLRTVALSAVDFVWFRSFLRGER